MKTKIMKLKDITPAEYNPRKRLKPGDNEYETLKSSLDRFGIAVPLIVNETTGILVSGHQRLNVMLETGIEEAEVVLIKADTEQEKLLNIALNKIDGDWDYQKLEALFEEISADDMKFTGFSPDELSNLFENITPSWNETEEETEKIVDVSDEKEEKEPEKPHELKDFNIFLSFATKELAEKWLKDRGVELEFEGTARNITIRMDGLDYGTGNQGNRA